jgi:hypothetical protein
MTECTYNSSSRDTFTRGGFAAKDEMCLVFLHYYPASNLAHCASRLSFQHVLLALGINVWPLTPSTRHLGLRIRDPWQYQNLTFSDYLKISAVKDTAVTLKLQEASLHHSHKADCYDYGRRRIYAVSQKECFFFKWNSFLIEIQFFRMESSFPHRGSIIPYTRSTMAATAGTVFMTLTTG